MQCPKCGSEDQFSGATLLPDGKIVYEYGCEDCGHMGESDARFDFDIAVSQAKERFLK